MERAQRLARKAEQETADRHGGRATPASGSGDTIKNDVRNPEWSIEVKSTQQLGYRLTRDDLTRAEEHALADGRRMAFLIDFLSLPATYPRYRPGRYVVMTENDHLEREQKLEQHTEVIKGWVDKFGALRDEADKLTEETARLWERVTSSSSD